MGTEALLLLLFSAVSSKPMINVVECDVVEINFIYYIEPNEAERKFKIVRTGQSYINLRNMKDSGVFLSESSIQAKDGVEIKSLTAFIPEAGYAVDTWTYDDGQYPRKNGDYWEIFVRTRTKSMYAVIRCRAYIITHTFVDTEVEDRKSRPFSLRRKYKDFP